MPKKFDTNFDYNEEVRKCKTIDDVMGKNGLIQKLVKDVLENILEGEDVDLDVPRDRNAEFEPQIIKNMKLSALNWIRKLYLYMQKV